MLNINSYNENNYELQVWVGLAMVIGWCLLFIYKNLRQIAIENEEDVKNTTASDFTVIIENLPAHYTKESFQRDLDVYREWVKDKMVYPDPDYYPDDTYDGGFTIAKFNSANAHY